VNRKETTVGPSSRAVATRKAKRKHEQVHDNNEAAVFFECRRKPVQTLPCTHYLCLHASSCLSLWPVNQLWPDLRQATLFNCIATALFVVDIFWVMIGWPPASPDESFAETYVEAP
jgi:hypothetical protein